MAGPPMFPGHGKVPVPPHSQMNGVRGQNPMDRPMISFMISVVPP